MGVNQMTGTPWHLETLHMEEGDERRDKRRCIHYKKANKFCSKLKTKCPGSSHCDYYKEDPAKVRKTPEPELYDQSISTPASTAAVTPVMTEPEISIPDTAYDTSVFVTGCHVKHNKYGCGIVTKLEANYITIKFDNGLTKELDLEYCVKNSLITREYTEEELRIAKEEAERKAKEALEQAEIARQKAQKAAEAAANIRKPVVSEITYPADHPDSSISVASRTPVYAVSYDPNTYSKPQSPEIRSNEPAAKSDDPNTRKIVCWAIWLVIALLHSVGAICLSIYLNSVTIYVETILLMIYLSSLFVITNPFTGKDSYVPIMRWIKNHLVRAILIATLIWLFLAGYAIGAIGAFAAVLTNS